ncbi:tetratricopeptide repeat protein [Streptomyces sp. VRA16 Mangrove soil]|uniref:tetratricopeptide repeat protein n=1 Tax=Streptomyces sp. VRA16 Mangrove soil TaxID=2817434 RepID=UPI001A9E8E16|nr:tetratricopeptide repeat protein [Streptomyces sp. VRA16 Mangrove soil]MBO1331944.1 tetratricopeptide repeat protein [Streptomyces sp. VRA16 Mangrove soil]
MAPRLSGRTAVAACALALALTGGAVAIGGGGDGHRPTVAAEPPPQQLGTGGLDRSVQTLQTHLRSQPQDFGAWATLGTAYVEQARTLGDPSRYPQAQRALSRSLKLRPDGNDAALAGRAALAAARHDFRGALRDARRALAVNPYSERALSTRIDALVELGRYGEAGRAASEADARRPGIPVFTRFSYVRELRGDVTGARRVLRQALASASSPADEAYVATALGQLAWRQGDFGESLRDCGRALRADASYVPALECRGRARAGRGDTAAAVADLRDVVARYPLPGPLVELGELYEKQGKLSAARAQYGLVSAWIALARANGVDVDLDTALAAAEHGDRKAALRAARAEWARRHTVHTADALGWALHVNGHDSEALRYARFATHTGYRDATFFRHRGIVARGAERKEWLNKARTLT